MSDDRFSLPVGTVTFLLTDIEGSSRMWEQDPDAAAKAVARHYAILDESIGRHGGVRPLEQGEGDSVVAAFSRASDAAAAALGAQLAIRDEDWPEGGAVKVRMALHTGEAQLRDEANYFGRTIIRCARLRAIGHGGQVLLSGATHDLVIERLSEGASVVDLGSHRLRDLGRPEHVYELRHAGDEEEFPPLRSLEVIPNNLPVQLSTFIGRADDLAAVGELLSSTRLVTITGAGGAGKTRLALQTAAEVLDEHPDGVWWVDLAPLRDPDLVAATALAALGVQDDPTRPALDRLVKYLTDASALICLDNCEHLLGACAAVAEALLRSCPNLTVLATSREALNVGGETSWRVPPLSTPPNGEAQPIAALSQYEAVRLFIDRARRARPNFQVTDETAPAIAQICFRLDGIPLALELAAARTRMLSAEQIATALDDRFRLLTGGSRTAVPRQQTLRASVEWSHDLLSESERALFRRLGVFAGGFTLDGAEAVGAADEIGQLGVLDLLAQLVDKSLVLVEEEGAEARYRLLETIRQYALERLSDAAEVQVVRDRHLQYVVDLAESLEESLEHTPQAGALARLEKDHDNVRGALEWALSSDNGELALRAASALTLFWQHRGYLREAIGWYERALEAGEAADVVRAKALWGLGHVSVYAADFGRVFSAATEAAALASSVGDLAIQARALKDAAFVSAFMDLETGRRQLADAVAIARQTDDAWCLADGLQLYAYTWVFQEDWIGMREPLDESGAMAREMGNRYFQAWDLVPRGARDWRLGEFDAARATLEEAIRASREVGEPSTFATAVMFLCGTLCSVGDYDGARSLGEEALTELRRFYGLLVPEGALTGVGNTETIEGRPEQGLAVLEEVLATVRAEGIASTTSYVAGLAAVAARHLGDAGRAAELAAESRAVGENLKSPPLVASARHIAGLIAFDRGDLEVADGELHAALVVRVELGHRPEAVDSLEALAAVAAAHESDQEAVRLLGAAASARQAIGYQRYPVDEPAWQRAMAAVRLRLGDETFEAAWAEGEALDLDAAATYASRARGERGRPSIGWESLTPTEIEVVRLAAQGLTNPEIGERLFISRGTVKTHLAHVFAKVGVANRSELAAEVTRRDL